MKAATPDAGRMDQTKAAADRGKWKTPTLRNVGETPPYMHDGSEDTLEAVIDFYDRGGVPNPNLSGEIRPLQLTPAEKSALLAFLRALTGPVRNAVPPPADAMPR
jgi:cytochrome c peroxidase